MPCHFCLIRRKNQEDHLPYHYLKGDACQEAYDKTVLRLDGISCTAPTTTVR